MTVGKSQVPCSCFILRGSIVAELADRWYLIRKNKFQQKKRNTSKIRNRKKITPVDKYNQKNSFLYTFIYIGVKKNVYFDMCIKKRQSELATNKRKRKRSILFQSLRHKKMSSKQSIKATKV